MVITGWFPVSRGFICELILKCGGSVQPQVNELTQILLVGQRPGMKLFRADELGIPLLMYTDLGTLAGIEAVY